MTWNNHVQEIKDGKKEMLFSELHSLLSSGLDFGRSFRLLIEGESDKHLKRLLESLYASVVKGKHFGRVFQLANVSRRWIVVYCESGRKRDVSMNHYIFWRIITTNE